MVRSIGDSMKLFNLTITRSLTASLDAFVNHMPFILRSVGNISLLVQGENFPNPHDQKIVINVGLRSIRLDKKTFTD